MSDVVDIPPDYYRRNFEVILADVGARYGEFLLPVERSLMESYHALSHAARCVYVRMLTRKGPWFRRETLEYAEIADTDAALAEAMECGLVLDGSAATLADYTSVLNRAELAEIAGRLVGGRKWRAARRGDLLDWLTLHGGEDALALARDMVRIFSPAHTGEIGFFVFLFFGNAEQSLTDFVLEQIGNVVYEAYPVSYTDRLFPCRADAEALWRLHRARSELEEELSRADDATRRTLLSSWADRLLTLELPGSRAQRRLGRLLALVGRDLEREGDLDGALRCFAATRELPARERTARILKARGEMDAAAELAISIVGAPVSVVEERFADGFLRRLAKTSEVARRWCCTCPARTALPSLSLVVRRAEGVEMATLAHAASMGKKGFFAENVLWRGIFGLAFWDVIFAPLPGVFQHRFQRGPLDIGSLAFFESRASLFRERFEELRRPGELLRRVLATHHAKSGVANLFVDWSWLAPEMLELALCALPLEATLGVLERMAPHPLRFDNGFPDLFLLDEATGRAELWEVKGPGDQIRPEQDFWLRVFADLGVPAYMVRVKYE